MVASPTATTSTKSQLAALLKRLLDRSYRNGVDRIVRLEVAEDRSISGSFSDRGKLFDFEWKSGKLSYKKSDRRQDTYNQSYLDYLSVRTDKKDVCKTGLSCGETCIPQDNTCRVSGSSAPTAAEAAAVDRLAANLAPEEKPDPYKGKTIRELKALASEAGVYRYSYMGQEELKNSLKALESDPDRQERLRRTLERKREERKIIEQATPQKLSAIWKQISSASKLAGKNPEAAAIIAITTLAGVTASVAQRMRDRYKSGLQESAQMAYQRAQRMPVDNVRKPNILFAVGGFSGIGSTGDRLKEQLETPQDDSPGEKWLGGKNHIVPFSHREFDIPPTGISKRNPDGSYNPAYLGYVAKNGFGSFIGNYKRGRNEAAVDLAAQMYAYGSRYRKAPLSVLAHGVGGNVTDEAIEILSRMKPGPDQKGALGSEMLSRLNVVRLGTPYFGFTNDRAWGTRIRNRTITSSQDPFSGLPKRMAQWVSTVKGHEVSDYMGDREVRDRLKEAFGFYESSSLGRQAQLARRAQTRKEIGGLLERLPIPGAARIWNEIGRAQDMAEENPLGASIAAGSAAIGASAVSYAYLRKRYVNNGRAQAASDAMSLVQTMRSAAPTTKKPSTLYVVGGEGMSSADMSSALLDDTTTRKRPTDKNNFFATQNEIYPVDDEGFETLTSDRLQERNPLFLGSLTRGAYGRALGNIFRGRNQAATQLAARLYVDAEKAVREGRTINLAAYGAGGLTAREAISILRRMGDGKGKAFSNSVRLVTFGTPSFGFVDPDVQEISFMSPNDPFSRLPQRQGGKARFVMIPSVAGHSAQDYLNDPTVLAQTRDWFSQPRSSRRRANTPRPAEPDTSETPPPAPKPKPKPRSTQAPAPDQSTPKQRKKRRQPTETAPSQTTNPLVGQMPSLPDDPPPPPPGSTTTRRIP